jgi:hypothetical protein
MVMTNMKTMPYVDFTDVGNGKWLCNICKADVMTIQQAVTHEGSAQHSSSVATYGIQATSSAARIPTSDILSSLRRAEEERNHWTDLTPNLVSFWRRGLAAAERGEEAESMHEFLDKLEEELAESSQGRWGSSPVNEWGWGTPAEDWTPTPDVWASAWGTPAAQVPTKVQQVHHRREGSSSITSMHQEGTLPDRDEAHDDDNEFVENFLQHHAVDARRRERMRDFFEVRRTSDVHFTFVEAYDVFQMPTEQKIRKIQEVIRDLQG